MKHLSTFCFLSFFAAQVSAQIVYNSQYVGDALVHSATKPGNTGVPFIFVPGLNLASYIFCTTPDGRLGWADIFASAGHDTYIINDPDFDFVKDPAGVVTPKWTVPEAGPPADPTSSQFWQRDIWARWGFGESQGNPYPDVRFPTDNFDVFAANYPYVGSSTQTFSNAIEELLLLLNTTVILAPHSAGGPQAVAAAKNLTSLVLGFVFLEPTGPPDETDFPALAGMNMFAPYADRIDSRRQTGRKAGVEAAAALFAANGGIAEVISLPDDLGIFGNTHLFMQDDNSEFIASLIINATDAWVEDVEPVVPVPSTAPPTSTPSNISQGETLPTIIPTSIVPTPLLSNTPSDIDAPTSIPTIIPTEGPDGIQIEEPSDASNSSSTSTPMVPVEVDPEVIYDSQYVGDALVHSATKPGNTGIPFIFVPGLNLASYIFCTTPDGRLGWADIFASAGHDTYIINDPDFDFVKDPAGVVTPKWTVPEAGPPADPTSSQFWQRDIWARWGFGESQGNPYPDVRFPTDNFDVFAANYPYVGSSTQTFSNAIEELLLLLNTTVILAPHSAGGPQAVAAAKNLTSLVLGFVFLEPTGPPDETDFPALAGMNMFAPYADRIDSRRQTGRKAGVEAAAALFAANGGIAEVISLPDDLGIFGNTHLFMQDDNSEFIASLIINATDAWVEDVEPVVPVPSTAPPTSTPSNVSQGETLPTIMPIDVPSEAPSDAPGSVPPIAIPSDPPIPDNEMDDANDDLDSTSATPLLLSNLCLLFVNFLLFLAAAA